MHDMQFQIRWEPWKALMDFEVAVNSTAKKETDW